MWKRNKKLAEDSALEKLSDKAASNIGGQLRKAQSWFGTSMNKRTQHLDKRGKIVFLVVFALLFGGASAYILIDSIANVQSGNGDYVPHSMAVPKHFDKTGEEPVHAEPIISAAEILKIREFRHFMDSLSISKTGIVLYDSIVHARPGLLDSLDEAERLFVEDSIANHK